LRIKSGKSFEAIQLWDAITSLVPGRTKMYCHARWCDAMDPRIICLRANTRATACRGWTPDEGTELTSAVTSNSKAKPGKKMRIDWVADAALMLDRTSRQCSNRWRVALGPRIHRTRCGTNVRGRELGCQRPSCAWSNERAVLG
jgi:hypothetical protein